MVITDPLLAVCPASTRAWNDDAIHGAFLNNVQAAGIGGGDVSDVVDADEHRQAAASERAVGSGEHERHTGKMHGLTMVSTPPR